MLSRDWRVRKETLMHSKKAKKKGKKAGPTRSAIAAALQLKTNVSWKVIKRHSK